MTNSLGTDTAGCNGMSHWEIAKAKGIHFGAARATISWGYQDKWFPSTWRQMAQQGIHRFAYHVLHPSQPYKIQADNFLRVVGDQWDDAFPVDDFELDQGCSRTQITDCIMAFNEYVSARAPKVVNYSRASWVNQFTNLGTWRTVYDWWLAQYLKDRSKESPAPPDLPTGVTKWLVHQNADHVPSWPGYTPDGKLMDVDRWNGDDTVVDDYFSNRPTPPLPPPPVLNQLAIVWRELQKHFPLWNYN